MNTQPETSVAVPVTEAEAGAEAEDEEVRHKAEWNGFKIVGDNVDKKVRPSFQRLERHYTTFTLTP